MKLLLLRSGIPRRRSTRRVLDTTIALLALALPSSLHAITDALIH